jgi:hypothetical protein
MCLYDRYQYNSTSTAMYGSLYVVYIYDKNTLEEISHYTRAFRTARTSTGDLYKPNMTVINYDDNIVALGAPCYETNNAGQY